MTPPEVTPGVAGAAPGGQRSGSGSGGSYYDRISKLSERLSGLQQGLEHERNVRFDHLSVKMQDVDARLQSSQDAVQRECGQLKEQLSKFQRDFDEERLNREGLQDAKSKELSAIDVRLQQQLELEQHARRESEAKVLRSFDEKTATLREEIAREVRTRQEAEAALRRYVDVDIPKLEESLRLQEAILTEKKAREDTE